MKLTEKEQKKAAKEFVEYWQYKSLISRDIPAIIAIGPCSEENAINLYELKTESIDRIASYNEINTVRNHYFNVTAIIEDKVKIDNGYWDGIMYEVSSWGSKYYISKKDMDDFITVHTPFFTNVVNVY